LLGCEVLGGGENFDYLVSTNGTGPDACTRWMGPLSAADATDKFQNFSGPEYMYTPAPRGRLIADEVCAEPFTTDFFGRVGFPRLLLAMYKSLLFPILLTLTFKILASLCLRGPCMKQVRQRNEKLQRAAAKRKGEVRRLHDKGNEFVVKRLVKKEGGSAEEALNKLKEMAIIPQNKTDKQKQITSGLFNKLKTASQSTKSRQSQSCTTTITTTTSSEVVHNEYSVDAHLDGPPAMLDHSSALSSTTCVGPPDRGAGLATAIRGGRALIAPAPSAEPADGVELSGVSAAPSSATPAGDTAPQAANPPE